jgi:hypothetical protein
MFCTVIYYSTNTFSVGHRCAFGAESDVARTRLIVGRRHSLKPNLNLNSDSNDTACFDDALSVEIDNACLGILKRRRGTISDEAENKEALRRAQASRSASSIVRNREGGQKKTLLLLKPPHAPRFRNSSWSMVTDIWSGSLTGAASHGPRRRYLSIHFHPRVQRPRRRHARVSLFRYLRDAHRT